MVEEIPNALGEEGEGKEVVESGVMGLSHFVGEVTRGVDAVGCSAEKVILYVEGLSS